MIHVRKTRKMTALPRASQAGGVASTPTRAIPAGEDDLAHTLRDKPGVRQGVWKDLEMQ